jgi:hypothetical protein
MPQPTGTAPDLLFSGGAVSWAASRMNASIWPDLVQVSPSARTPRCSIP